VDLSPPRGTADLIPPVSGRVRALSLAFGRHVERYGYRYVETPGFEGTELFARTSGSTSDVVRKEMYTFEDKGGRLITLRPEPTAGIVRAYLSSGHELPSPFKAYTVGTMWRYGRPQTGRLREFRQFDIEVLGSGAPAADVEVLAVGDRFLRGLGLDRIELQLNSIGDEECRPAYREELIGYFEANAERLHDEHRDRFRENPLRVLDCKDEACRELSAGAPKIADRLCEPCREHFDAVQRGLKAEGVESTFVATLVRGLDYYTRTTFEWTSQSLPGGQASVGGGGRYDGLAEVLGGPATPAVGFGIGVERILLSLKGEGLEVQGVAKLDCFVVSVGPAAEEAAAGVARSLRDAGLAVDAPFESRPLKAQLRMADRSGARFAAIVGEKEAAGGTVTVRRLADGRQEEMGLDRAVAWVLTQGEPS
jgi:histidyl-tRNA synthetase